MKISLIAALDRQRAIGIDNKLPWHLPDDLKFFKQQTQGGVIVMGRKTFESIGSKPLPNRRNIVLTRQKTWQAEGIEIAFDLDFLLQQLRQENIENVWVIGGGVIYDACITQATDLVLTQVDTELVLADAFFPEVDTQQWRLVEEVSHIADERHAYAFSWQKWEKIAQSG